MSEMLLGCGALHLCVHYVCQVRLEDAYLKGGSVLIELVRLREYSVHLF